MPNLQQLLRRHEFIVKVVKCTCILNTNAVRSVMRKLSGRIQEGWVHMVIHAFKISSLYFKHCIIITNINLYF